MMDTSDLQITAKSHANVQIPPTIDSLEGRMPRRVPRAARWTGGCTCQDNLFHSWLYNTTIHGIVHVFTSKSPIVRIFWTAIFLGALVGCLYNVVDRFITYIDRPTSTSVAFEVNDGVQFPEITVCNMNPITVSYLNRVDKDDAINNLLLILYDVTSLLGLLEDTTDENELTEALLDFCWNQTANNVTEIPFHEAFSSSRLLNFIDECYFIGDFESCKDKFVPVFTNLGLCYTLDIGKRVKKSGIAQGVRLVLNITQSEYLTPFYSNAGAKISVHPQGVFPEPDEQGIAVPPGKNAYIALREERVVDKTKENNCQSADSELNNFPGAKYSLSRCRANSAINSFSNACSCRDPVGEPEFLVGGQRGCRFSDICCAIRSNVFSNEDNCSPACTTTSYRTSVSYAQYPADNSAGFIASLLNATPDAILRDSVAVNVYFEDIMVTVSTTVYSYSFSAFLSDLGGQLGLFLGASVISMLEFFFFLVDEVGQLCASEKTGKFSKWIEDCLDKYVPRAMEEDVDNDAVPKVTEDDDAELSKDADTKL